MKYEWKVEMTGDRYTLQHTLNALEKDGCEVYGIYPKDPDDGPRAFTVVARRRIPETAGVLS